MGMKIMIRIQGNLYDLWEVRSIEKAQFWDEDGGDDGEGALIYQIVMNRKSIALNLPEIVFKYDDEFERDSALQEIAEKLSEYETVVIL